MAVLFKIPLGPPPLGRDEIPARAGILIWNKTRGKKNPDTGKYKYFPNPRSGWIIEQRPELRIIDEALWNRVIARRKKRAQPRGAAISKGIAHSKKRAGGRDSRYLLGGSSSAAAVVPT